MQAAPSVTTFYKNSANYYIHGFWMFFVFVYKAETIYYKKIAKMLCFCYNQNNYGYNLLKNQEEDTMASIAEKSRTKEIIDRFQNIIHNAPAVPLAQGKISVYKDEVQALLTELAAQMEIELKTYHEVNDRRGKIISEAKKEAERIIYQAEHSASRMRVMKGTTGVSPVDYEHLPQEELDALSGANEIYGASLIYTDEMLNEVTNLIRNAYSNIRSDYETMLQVLEDKLQVVESNRAELMTGLQELEAPERSQQIMEIGQLLSNELYMSRMRAKTNAEKYEDGSMQLAFDFEKEQREYTQLVEEQLAGAQEQIVKVEESLKAIQAERDELKETVRRLQEGAKRTAAKVESQKEIVPENTLSEKKDEEEYEIVYVTEDELEEGEEYEIEYVDEEEYEAVYGAKEQEAEAATEEMTEKEMVASTPQEAVADSDKELQPEEVATGTADKKSQQIKTQSEPVEKDPVQREENTGKSRKKDRRRNRKTAEGKEKSAPVTDKEEQKTKTKADTKPLPADSGKGTTPVVPRFKKSESVASVSSEKVAKMAKAITTEQKYSGLISRAVKERERAEERAAVSVEETEDIPVTSGKKPKEETSSAKKTEYAQKKLETEEDFEIMEF